MLMKFCCNFDKTKLEQIISQFIKLGDKLIEN